MLSPNQAGTDYLDYGDGIAMGEDGSVVVAGGTAEYWDTTDIPTVRSYDMAAFKLHSNGTLMWKWQVSTAEACRQSARGAAR